MTVPFEQIGDAQVGRIVLQVIGKDGPVFNPRNIRYLGPGDPGFPSLPSKTHLMPNLVGLAAGLAGVNLMVSIGNLALSAIILKEVKSLSKKMDEAHNKILGKLDSICDRVRVIDIKVQENNLRESLKYLSRACVVDNTIDLMEIKKIEGDVRRFLDTVGDYGYVRGLGFELSYDVREKLTSLHSFLYATRKTIAVHHNIRAGGNPANMLTMHPVEDYRPDQMLRADNPMPENAVEKIFLDLSEDIEGRVRKHADTKEKVWQVFGGRHVADDCKDRIIQAAQQLQQMRGKLNDHFLPVSAPETSWLWNSDMGLAWRTHRELKAIGDYRKEFRHWNLVDAEPLGSDNLLIDSSWEKPLELPKRSTEQGRSQRRKR